MNHPDKARTDLVFYFGVGMAVYSIRLLAYLVDYVDRGGHTFFDYTLLITFFAVDVWLITSCKHFKNWARNAFIVKFIILAFVFYPHTWLLKGGSWMYSPGFPLGVFQRMSNFGGFFYEFFFTLHMIKRSVRLEFIHPS